jgi:DNA-binding transcriptional ArsR family regulator
MAENAACMGRHNTAPRAILAESSNEAAQAPDLCPNRGAAMSEAIDVHSYRSNDPHTAIPDWLPFATTLTAEARNLIMASLVLEKRQGPPTRRQLARALGVDERSIYRWLREIGAAGALSIRRDKRRRINVFHRPIPDRMIADPLIADQAISDQAIRMSKNDSKGHARQQSHERRIPDQLISDPPVGVGVGHDSSKESEPTTTNRRPLKTKLARELKRRGMNAARDFDDPALDLATYLRFVDDKRAIGWEWRQIVSTLREAPLEPQPCDPLAPDWYADDQADDQAAPAVLLDSTARQLARQYERDRLEALARGAGLVNARGESNE